MLGGRPGRRGEGRRPVLGEGSEAGGVWRLEERGERGEERRGEERLLRGKVLMLSTRGWRSSVTLLYGQTQPGWRQLSVWTDLLSILHNNHETKDQGPVRPALWSVFVCWTLFVSTFQIS